MSPRVPGAMHRHPGLDAREKLTSVETEMKALVPNLHAAMMSRNGRQVKPHQIRPSARRLR